MRSEPRPPFPRQHQAAPGIESRLKPRPRFGSRNPMGRPAQPEELAPAYVHLASDADSSYVTGTVMQVMGEETTGG